MRRLAAIIFNSALFIPGATAQSSTTTREMKHPEYMQGFRFQASRAEQGFIQRAMSMPLPCKDATA